MGHRVTVLALPGVLPLEFGIAAQIFGTDPHYELTVCAAGPVQGDGFCLTATAGLCIWIVIWSLNVSGLDAILLAIVMVLVAIGVRNLLPFLPGRRD